MKVKCWVVWWKGTEHVEAGLDTVCMSCDAAAVFIHEPHAHSALAELVSEWTKENPSKPIPWDVRPAVLSVGEGESDV